MLKTCVSKISYCRGECKGVYQAQSLHSKCGSCLLETAQQFYHDIRGEGGSRVTSKLKQGAHIHQPTAWPLPVACAEPYHAGSGIHGQLLSPLYWGSSASHSRRSVTGKNPCFFASWRSKRGGAMPLGHENKRKKRFDKKEKKKN